MKTRILLLMVIIVLTAGPTAWADKLLTNDEQRAARFALLEIQTKVNSLKASGTLEAARLLEERLRELNVVEFRKEATGPIDTPIVMLGRLAGGDYYAYTMPGTPGVIYLHDNFFALTANAADPSRQRLAKVEQASLLLHENMHLNHDGAEDDAYKEQYKWLRFMGINADGSVDWTARMADGSKYKSTIMINTLTKLREQGVDVAALENSLKLPPPPQKPPSTHGKTGGNPEPSYPGWHHR